MYALPRDPDEGFCDDDQIDQQPALRLWVSDAQWQAILNQVEHRSRADAEQYAEGENPGWWQHRSEPRWPHHARCLIRVAGDNHSEGTFLARTRNVSTQGVGFLCGRPLQTGARCTVALQAAEGDGRIIAGKVAWCRQVTQSVTTHPAFEIGVQYDQPIDLDPLLGAA